MAFHILEFIKFIKEKLIMIILGTVFFTIVFAFLFKKQQDDELSKLETNIETGIEQIEVETDARPANFYFFVETDEGNTFTNNLLIEQYLLSNTILKDASQQSDSDLVTLIEETGNNIKVNYNEANSAKILGVSRNESTHLMEFTINVGNERKNRALANYFFNLILSEEVEFLASKHVYVFKEPSIKDVDSIDTAVLSEDETEEQGKSLIRIILESAILGGTLSIFVLFIAEFFKKKLVYSFSYKLEDADTFLLIDKKLDNMSEFKQMIKVKSQRNMVISENHTLSINTYNMDFLNSELLIHSILDIEKIENVDSLTFLIEEGYTTRKWYNQQRRLNKNYSIPIRIVQLNQ